MFGSQALYDMWYAQCPTLLAFGLCLLTTFAACRIGRRWLQVCIAPFDDISPIAWAVQGGGSHDEVAATAILMLPDSCKETTCVC